MLSDHQMEVLLLHTWPEKYQSNGAGESGLGAVIFKIQNDEAAKNSEGSDATDDSGGTKDAEVEVRRADAVGDRTNLTLQQIDSLALELQHQEADDSLNPRFRHWRADLANIEDAFIQDPEQTQRMIAGFKLKMLSSEEKIYKLTRLADRLRKDHVTAIPPLVWKKEEHVREDQEAEPTPAENLVNRLGFVFMAYRVDVWWWEACERLHIFLMTAGLVFIYPESPAQMATGAMISFAFLMANVIKQPYCTDDLNLLKAMSLFAQFITLFCGIMISFIQSVDTVGDADQQLDFAVVSFMMVVTNVSVILLPIIRPIIGGNFESYLESAAALLGRLPCAMARSTRSESGIERKRVGELPLWKVELQSQRLLSQKSRTPSVNTGIQASLGFASEGSEIQDAPTKGSSDDHQQQMIEDGAERKLSNEIVELKLELERICHVGQEASIASDGVTIQTLAVTNTVEFRHQATKPPSPSVAASGNVEPACEGIGDGNKDDLLNWLLTPRKQHMVPSHEQESITNQNADADDDQDIFADASFPCWRREKKVGLVAQGQNLGSLTKDSNDQGLPDGFSRLRAVPVLNDNIASGNSSGLDVRPEDFNGPSDFSCLPSHRGDPGTGDGKVHDPDPFITWFPEGIEHPPKQALAHSCSGEHASTGNGSDVHNDDDLLTWLLTPRDLTTRHETSNAAAVDTTDKNVKNVNVDIDVDSAINSSVEGSRILF